jgi:hypothetical protein
VGGRGTGRETSGEDIRGMTAKGRTRRGWREMRNKMQTTPRTRNISSARRKGEDGGMEGERGKGKGVSESREDKGGKRGRRRTISNEHPKMLFTEK